MRLSTLTCCKFGDATEVEVVRQNFRGKHLGQLHQLAVDFLDVGHIVLVELHFHARVELQHLEHFQAAPSARPLHVVGRIGDVLQFVEHKPRDDEHRIEKPRRAHFLNATVDDDVRIEQHQPLGLVLPHELHVGDHEIELVLGALGDHHRQVGADDVHDDLRDQLRLFVDEFEQNRVADEVADGEPDENAERGRR